MIPSNAIWPSDDALIQAIQEREEGTTDMGFCLACGEACDGCEPDARDYECEYCDQPAVFGAEEILLMRSA